MNERRPIFCQPEIKVIFLRRNSFALPGSTPPLYVGETILWQCKSLYFRQLKWVDYIICRAKRGWWYGSYSVEIHHSLMAFPWQIGFWFKTLYYRLLPPTSRALLFSFASLRFALTVAACWINQHRSIGWLAGCGTIYNMESRISPLSERRRNKPTTSRQRMICDLWI